MAQGEIVKHFLTCTDCGRVAHEPGASVCSNCGAPVVQPKTSRAPNYRRYERAGLALILIGIVLVLWVSGNNPHRHKEDVIHVVLTALRTYNIEEPLYLGITLAGAGCLLCGGVLLVRGLIIRAKS